ncbi:MAG: DUF2281 domain-containing protein [Alphaproteobacteria bacterium]|nr:DUF2281 domain-containing protein [Alphaproteobacteria bacterium]MBF0354583.1 DUF2281 domain-containing protein [Alphaproteobacteria bacterium]
MGYAEVIEKLRSLPEAKQAEVFDFIEFLANREDGKALAKGDWSNAEFSSFSIDQAMRGMEDDPVTYSLADLKERWQ